MHSLITITAPIWEADIPALNDRFDAMGNPPRDDIRDALDLTDADGFGTHFVSLHAISDNDGSGNGHILLELTADGDEERAVQRLADAIEGDLKPIFERARDWRPNVDLATYLKGHRITVGSDPFVLPGLCFTGTPGMTVERILKEEGLAAFVSDQLDSGDRDMRPIDRLARIRQAVAADPKHRWALAPPGPPDPGEGSYAVLPLVASHPWVRALGGVALAVLGIAFFTTLALTGDIGDAGEATLWAAILVPMAGVALFLFLLSRLRSDEKSSWYDRRAPDPLTLAELGRRENHFAVGEDGEIVSFAQNHMISVTVRKPGLLRAITSRLVFSVIGLLAAKVYRRGFLGGISTIHAARWITIPDTRNLVFLSNYGGSWESYLEDFITRSRDALTGIWSNCIGFLPTRNLIQAGAADGERFKRYARASMAPTRFWYSAYPTITTAQIRSSAAIRRGLATALTNDEAQLWLALFGSAQRPDVKLETSQIQSLVFGGLGFMMEGTCILGDLPDDRDKARAFLRDIEPYVGFGDGRRLSHPAVIQIGLGARALEKLGLPDECLRGFAPAFREGMTAEGRARILGDIGRNAPEHWEWGREPPDLTLLLYGTDQPALAKLSARVGAYARANDVTELHRIPLARAEKPAIEPFGFVDGISQPIIRGSYQSYRKNDPIHLVEPGEFIIGYPDNRGNMPPEPELASLADSDNRLPVAEKSVAFGNTHVEAPRAVGRNGSYLVLRQLEQDVSGFWDYCEEEAGRLKSRLPAPYEVTKDYIAAKLVGRWCDGSSLVRNPYYTFDEGRDRASKRDRRAVSELCGDPRDVARRKREREAARAAAAKGETLRSATDPDDGRTIPAPAEPSGREDNDFLYGTEDPQALRCPFGAHIRRANPRDSLMPGSMEQVSISNRHRILRVGRLYRPKAGRDPGLMFMCLNGDIERQFEFVQQTWLVSPAFHGLAGEQDPLTSNRDGTGYVVPTHDGPVRLKPLPQFVKTLGGGYFFMPGRSFLRYLGGD